MRRLLRSRVGSVKDQRRRLADRGFAIRSSAAERDDGAVGETGAFAEGRRGCVGVSTMHASMAWVIEDTYRLLARATERKGRAGGAAIAMCA